MSPMHAQWVLTLSNPVVRDHVVRGAPLLPGLAYVDLAYQLFRAHRHEPHEIELRDLVILDPLSVGAGQSVAVGVRAEPAGDGVWSVTVEGRAAGEPAVHATAQMRRVPPVTFDDRIDLAEIARSAERAIDLDDVYARWRARDIVHRGFMKAHGALYVTPSAVYAECRVEGEALAQAGAFLFHPTLLDGSGLCGAAAHAILGGAPDDRLALPISYRSFRASRPLRGRCAARIRAESLRRRHDLAFFTVDLFDESGAKVAEIVDLATKEIRDAAGANRAGEASPAAPATPVEALLRELVARHARRPPEDIDPTMGHYEMGLTSSDLLALVREVEARLGATLSPTLFFEYPTIQELGEHIARAYPGMAEPARAAAAPEIRAGGDATPAPEDIAVIGMAGRFPAARNIDELWAILTAGKDCITEIPGERWDWRRFDGLRSPSGKPISRWGGFLADPDCFDAGFFRISPREAQRLDPQERLFLETCWEAIEDAGYTPQTLAASGGDAERHAVGVFAGVMAKDYALLGGERRLSERGIPVWQSSAPVANRVSYACNFHGPSMAIDTVCSSSLVAVHQAVRSLRAGECDVALAGGVNLSLHPDKYLAFGMMDMHASDGRCRTFGRGGDGYVSSEAVGAIVLKPLRRAIADRDHVYAVIRGTSTNHTGKVSGFTVPSPVAQAALVTQCLDETKTSPRTISYVEAHGTGTALGDPIEIDGLTKVFARGTGDAPPCAIGSIKSNIGHAEAAAGIAGVIKVALQLHHRTLVPSLHAEELNPHVDWQRTPFVVQRDLRRWDRPVTSGGEAPRRAIVNSFGATGSNAHALLEEHVDASAPAAQAAPGAVLVPLSARDPERLRAYAARLLAFLEARRDGAADGAAGRSALADVAYTLQVGRVAMEARVAFVASQEADLIRALRAYLAGDAGAPGCYHAGSGESAPAGGDGRLAAAARAWGRGGAVAWRELHDGAERRRVRAPTYPFARERYWLPEGEEPAGAPIHPLVHENTSDWGHVRFTSTFTGREWFLRDHAIGGAPTLPAAASLEMAREAIERARVAPDRWLGFEDVIWSRPVAVSDAVTVHVALREADRGRVEFVLYSGAESDDGDGAIVHARGAALFGDRSAAPVVDLAAIRAACDRTFAGDACYAWFAERGLSYGPAHRGLERVDVGTTSEGELRAVAEVSLPPSLAGSAAPYLLHPSVLDAALQAYAGAALAAGTAALRVPFALGRVEVWGPTPARAFAYLRPRADPPADDGSQRLDVDLCDESGRVCVRMKDLTARPVPPSGDAAAPDRAGRAALLERVWRSAPIAAPAAPGASYARHVVLLDACFAPHAAAIRAAWPAAEVATFAPGSTDAGARVVEQASDLLDHVSAILRAPPARPVLVQVAVDARTGCASALSGMLKSAQIEQPLFRWRLLEIEDDGAPILTLLDDARASDEPELRYRDGLRHWPEWRPLDAAAGEPPWKDGGVYLISGGSGGLGLIFAGEITGRVEAATVILAGRTEPSDRVAEQIDRLRRGARPGTRIEHLRLDVADAGAVAAAVNDILRRHGRLDGVIHAAGVLRDSFLVNKTKEDLDAVAAPKIFGVQSLDAATRDVALDFFLVFSSDAGVLGNVGQADYALANAFLDAFAERRAQLAARGLRRGHTLTIDWTLWAEGGMRMDTATEERFRRLGLDALTTREGVAALYRAFATGRPHVLTLVGDHRRAFAMHRVEAPGGDAAGAGAASADDTARAAAYLTGILSDTLKLPPERIDPGAPFEEYGIDSVLALHMVNALEATFGALSKTLLFEHQSIAALAAYFLENHRDRLAALSRPEARPIADRAPRTGDAARRRTRRAPRAAREIAARPTGEPGPWDIAIIGVSGRYPQANDIDELWQNLTAGKDSITEVPADRWDHSLYFDPEAITPDKTYSKWGGFIDGVDRFDPLFFHVAPRDAAAMDPQERLFLECVHALLEDAGYTREGLRARGGGDVGVFVGAMYEEYQLHGTPALGRPLEGSAASIANRVSYFFDLHGPSMAVDTMCSSSLTSIYLACQSLLHGGCEVAIAGGVNVSVHPNKYLLLSRGKFASRSGRCAAFGAGADGYVPGEGVGAVLLKPLRRAEADGDHIYGVIKGAALNHGGKTNGYTVPNPAAQADVIARALAAAGMDARAVSYVEAHGTGTSLGDPIEIGALTRTFGADTADTGYCAIGSLKSNIGHCEGAAGVAGLTKVLLQMMHATIAPTLHARDLNPHIDFDRTPFFVAREAGPWPRPRLMVGGREVESPRIAGVSSFGAGGANAHVIVEEYTAPRRPARPPADQAALIVLSAKSEDALKRRAERLLDAVRRGRYGDADLPSIAYTLQVGREAMDVRMACVVRSLAELDESLRSFIEGGSRAGDLYRGEVKRNKEGLLLFTADDDLQSMAQSWAAKGKFSKLAALWVHGLVADWDLIHGEDHPARVRLPTYPFAGERYWAPERPAQAAPRPARAPSDHAASAEREALAALVRRVSDGTLDVDHARAEAAVILS